MIGGISISPARTLLASVALLALTWATALSAQATPTWLAPQTVSAPTAAPVGIEPAVAMGANGTIAGASWSEGGEIVADVRPAGAASFTQEAVSTPADKSLWPSVAVSAAGGVAVAWLDETAGQYEVAVRPPGGNFSAPIEVGPTGGALPQRTSVAIDNAGDVLVGEIEERIPAKGVAAYSWIPAGDSPSRMEISKPGDEASLPVVALNGAGDAIVAWFDKNGGSRDIARAITRPAGGTFGSVQNLTDNSEYAFALNAAIGEGGQAAVVWQRGSGPSPPYHVEASTSAGPEDLLSVPQTISPKGGSDEHPAVAVAGNGEVIAAWEQLEPTGAEDVASATAGGSFGAAVEASASGDFGTPSIAADGAGDAVLTWASTVEGHETVKAVTRTAAGTLTPAVTLSAPEEKVDYFITSGSPQSWAGMDAAGDATVGWEHAANHTSQVRIYDAAGPVLSVTGPSSVAAGFAAAFSTTASDLFSNVTSTTWSFGDGTGGEGSSISHMYSRTGTYTVTVTATDAVGNATSVSRQITVVPLVACADAAVPPGACPPSTCGPVRGCPLAARCIVPRLRGLSRHAASGRLRAVHCKLGRVTVPKRYRHSRRLVVSSQSPKPATKLASGSGVAITLKPAPRRHRGRRTR